MSEFFLAVVNMSISASWIVLAVLLLRLLLKKAPKWIAVLLWGIVAIRLICPFTIESVMSLIPSAETINPDVLVEQAPVIDPSTPVIDGVENPVINGTDTPVIGVPGGPTPDTTPANPVQTVITVSSCVWLAGIAGMLAYTVISYFRVKGKVGTAVRLRDHIFQSESVVSPFVLGLIKPKIYLPFCMEGQDMAYVIAHENAHIRRKDHWWKPIGFLILTLHWFNPLLWLGYALLCRDIELACDEKVIKELDFQQKADYSQALLNCSVNRRILAACPLAFGEVSVKDRVKSVLNYKKPAFWIIVVAIVASIVTAVCFLTDPVDKNPDDATQQTDSSDATENTEPTTPNKGETVKVAEPFASVLNSTKSFYFENEGKSVLLSDYYNSIWKLASVDIDHDGNKEIAVMFGAEDGTLILWQDGTSVYGYEFGVREIYRLNKDGTFLWNRNSGNTYGCSSIAFEGTKVKTTEVWRVEHDGSGGYTYYADNKPSTKEAVNAIQQVRNSEGVGWTVFSNDTTIAGTAEDWKEPEEPEDPYAIREITDSRVIAGEKNQTYRDSFVSLDFPLGWKCLEQWGEDGLFIYFQDPALGEKCQLSIYFAGATIYTYDYTREDYMAHFSGYYGYKDVVIDSFAKETIQGSPCTKIVYSYTEDNTRFVGTRYDDLIEESRLYHITITYPAAESKTYEKEFAASIESVRFLKSNQVDISSLPLKEAYDYAFKMYVAGPSSKYRDVGELQIETGQIIEIDGKYYQSYVASNADIRYVWISQAEFPDNNTALWDWYTVGTAQNYFLDLLGKIDEGRVEKPDKIDVADMDLLSTLYNKSPFITQKGTTVYLNAYKPCYKHSEDKDYYEKEIVFIPQEYTFVDLDKDGKKELIVSEAPYADTYLILREENKNIYGYSLPNRGFLDLKQDGSFQGSSGALRHDYNTISFSQNTYQISTIAKFYFEADDKKPVSHKYGYAPDYEKSVFEINGKPVSFEEIEQFAEQWKNRPEAVWMKLT